MYYYTIQSLSVFRFTYLHNLPPNLHKSNLPTSVVNISAESVNKFLCCAQDMNLIWYKSASIFYAVTEFKVYIKSHFSHLFKPGDCLHVKEDNFKTTWSRN